MVVFALLPYCQLICTSQNGCLGNNGAPTIPAVCLEAHIVQQSQPHFCVRRRSVHVLLAHDAVICHVADPDAAIRESACGHPNFCEDSTLL